MLVFPLLILEVVVDGTGEETGERQRLGGHSSSHVELLLDGVAFEELTDAERDDHRGCDYAWNEILILDLDF